MRNTLKSVVTGLAIAAVAAIATTKPAAATPSTLGFYPSTDIYGSNTFHYDADTYGNNFRTDAAVTNGITYGIGDKDGIFGRTEVGVDYYLSLGGGTPATAVEKRAFFNAKTQLYNNTDKGIRVVVGGWGIGNRDIFAPNYGYLLASKTFESLGRIHVGYAHSFSSKASIGDLTGKSHRDSLQLGYDKYITPKLQFCADFYSGSGAYNVVQPTLYYYINDKADFGVGYARFNSGSNDIAPTGNQVYLCFDYNFDFKGTKPAPTPETAPAAPATN